MNNKKGAVWEPRESTYHTMEISKDSQFLEICKEPILTDLPVLIKTWISVGAFWTFPPIRSLH